MYVLHGLDEFHDAVFVLDVTDVTGTTPTLDVFVQLEIAPGVWTDLGAFAQMTGVGQRIMVVSLPGTFAEGVRTDGSLARATTRVIPLGAMYRARWDIAGVASPSFTFSVASDFYGSSRVIREEG
jgi:hypothetical protein